MGNELFNELAKMPKKVLLFEENLDPQGQDFLMLVRPDGSHTKLKLSTLFDTSDVSTEIDQIENLLGFEVPISSQALAGITGSGRKIFYVSGIPFRSIAVYNVTDTTSLPDGFNILVDGDGRRFYTMTVRELLERIISAINIFDII